MAALDLIGDDVGALEITQAFQELGVNFRVNYLAPNYSEFRQLLFRQVTKRGWSTERLRAAVDNIIERFKFPSWTIADFMDNAVADLHPYSWVLDEVKKDATAMTRMDGFIVSETPRIVLWKYRDALHVPFPKVEHEIKREEEYVSAPITEETRKQIQQLKEKLNAHDDRRENRFTSLEDVIQQITK